jgi:hypothetical protein
LSRDSKDGVICKVAIIDYSVVVHFEEIKVVVTEVGGGEEFE